MWEGAPVDERVVAEGCGDKFLGGARSDGGGRAPMIEFVLLLNPGRVTAMIDLSRGVSGVSMLFEILGQGDTIPERLDGSKPGCQPMQLRK